MNTSFEDSNLFISQKNVISKAVFPVLEVKYKLGQKKKNTSQEVQLQQVCLENKIFGLRFNLVHYLVAVTLLKENIFGLVLGEKNSMLHRAKINKFDKVNSYTCS